MSLLKHPLDAIAQPVVGLVAWEGVLAGRAGGDDGLGAEGRDGLAESAAVVGGVGDDVVGGHAVEQCGGLGDVARLARRQDEA